MLENGKPSPTRRKLCLSLSRKAKGPLKDIGNETQKRFASPVKENVYNEAAEGVVPANTKQCNEWAVRAFRSWATQRNKPGASVPSDRLESNDPHLVAKFMRFFVLEARKEDGEQYTPGTIKKPSLWVEPNYEVKWCYRFHSR